MTILGERLKGGIGEDERTIRLRAIIERSARDYFDLSTVEISSLLSNDFNRWILMIRKMSSLKKSHLESLRRDQFEVLDILARTAPSSFQACLNRSEGFRVTNLIPFYYAPADILLYFDAVEERLGVFIQRTGNVSKWMFVHVGNDIRRTTGDTRFNYHNRAYVNTWSVEGGYKLNVTRHQNGLVSEAKLLEEKDVMNHLASGQVRMRYPVDRHDIIRWKDDVVMDRLLLDLQAILHQMRAK